jgi:hypothetical protein
MNFLNLNLKLNLLFRLYLIITRSTTRLPLPTVTFPSSLLHRQFVGILRATSVSPSSLWISFLFKPEKSILNAEKTDS